jgi:hypothetical protein
MDIEGVVEAAVYYARARERLSETAYALSPRAYAVLYDTVERARREVIDAVRDAHA